MFRRLIVALALVCLPSLAAAAEIPYSGTLFESGAPVNGNRYVQIDVYDFPVGGPSLYTQAESLAVVGGVFHTVLTVPDAVWFNGPHWFGVSVNGGSELSPRVKYYAPPRPTLLFVEHPSTTRTVTSGTWTKVDSLTITTSAPGTAVVTHTGTALWTGSISVPSIGFDIGPNSPITSATYVHPTQSGTVDPVNFTVMVPVLPGTTTIYLWARIGTTGQSFSLTSGRFQALYLPN